MSTPRGILGSVIPLIRRFLHEFLWHERRGRLALRGFLLWAGTFGAMLVADLEGAMTRWGWKGWGVRLLAAALVGSAGLVPSQANTGGKAPSTT